MKFDITPILEALVTLSCAVLTAFVIPYFKNRLTEEKQANLKYWARVAVEAAEQLFGGQSGEKKKEYAINFLLSKGIVFNVDEVTALVESEVYKLTSGT